MHSLDVQRKRYLAVDDEINLAGASHAVGNYAGGIFNCYNVYMLCALV